MKPLVVQIDYEGISVEVSIHDTVKRKSERASKVKIAKAICDLEDCVLEAFGDYEDLALHVAAVKSFRVMIDAMEKEKSRPVSTSHKAAKQNYTPAL